MNTRPSVLSLFAGIGGICTAFNNAGCDICLANERDRYACETYRNSHDFPLFEEDIVNLHSSIIRDDVDIVIGGFPCQPFSQAGEQLGFDDPKGRGLMFFEITRLIDELTDDGRKPRAIFLENVSRLNTIDNGNTIARIKREIESRGYSYSQYILNSKDYSRIPHNRNRIYIVALDKERCNPCIKPPSKKKHDPIAEYLHTDEKAEESYYIHPWDTKLYDKFKDSIVKQGVVYQYRRYYTRENKSGVCPALTANMGSGGHNVPMILDDWGIRKLTIDECLGLQGLKGIQFPANMARSHQYMQIGNSVTVPVVKMMAKRIVKAI